MYMQSPIVDVQNCETELPCRAYTLIPSEIVIIIVTEDPKHWLAVHKLCHPTFRHRLWDKAEYSHQVQFASSVRVAYPTVQPVY